MENLTGQQTKILGFITEFIDSHGYSPALRDIGTAFSIVSPNGIQCHLLALEKKGYIKRTPKTSRSITIIHREDYVDTEFDGLSDKLSGAEEERDFYKTRVKAIERMQERLPEPWRTLVCNVLANGSESPTLPITRPAPHGKVLRK